MAADMIARAMAANALNKQQTNIDTTDKRQVLITEDEYNALDEKDPSIIYCVINK